MVWARVAGFRGRSPKRFRSVLQKLLALCLLLSMGLSPRPALASPRSNLDLPQPFRRSPYTLMSLSVGSPTNGWQLRSKRLRSNTVLHVKRGSGSASYGHPALVLMLERSARQLARQSPGSVLLVGDLSHKYGGPIAGHRSHESGRDGDVGFFVRDRRDRPRTLDHFVAFDENGKAKDDSGLVFDDYRNWLLVQLWLKDHRATIQHVFVATHLRRRLLRFAASHRLFAKYVDDAAALLHQPRNASDHDDHFHVRIRCPHRQAPLCVENVTITD